MGKTREWAIRFAPGPEFMLNGANPLLLLQASCGRWAAWRCGPAWRQCRRWMRLDPERCYVSWEMVLATTAGRDAIRDVFIFVEDSCELTIEPLA